jgi:iron complex outermembrane receptor protein
MDKTTKLRVRRAIRVATGCVAGIAAAIPAVPAVADSAPGLEEVVVTAQRREESVQRAAIAVTAVSGDALVERSITQATDLPQLVPSLQVAQASALTQFYLRGIGTFGANAFADQGVSFNLDGVYLSRPAAPAGLFYDLERIEVLKGPQGTLYGRNASGGAINVITAKPVLNDTSGFGTLEFGNYSAVKATGAVNVPSGERAAYRLAGQYVNRDGYFSDGYDDEDTLSFRAQFKFDNGSGLDATVMADYVDVGGQGSGGTIYPLLDGDNRLGPSDPRVIAAYLARPPTPPVPQIIARDDGYQDNQFTGVMATVNVDVGFATLTVVPAWRETNLDYVGYASSFLIDVVEDSRQTSLEARLVGTGDVAKWVAGVYWFDESQTADQLFDQRSNATLIQSDLDTTSYAGFGQLTYSLTDTFRVTGGIRYTKDNKKQDTYAETRPFVGFVPPGPPNFIPIILTIPSRATTDVDFDKVTWKAGVDYDLTPSSLLYASVATGFKSGQLFSATGRNYSEPENLRAYTIGSKNRFLDNRVQLNAELFYWDYTDQQISRLAPVQVATTPAGPIFGPVFGTDNAGKSTIQGLEIEVLWAVTDDDRLSLNAQYLDTEYDDLRFRAYSVSGAPPVNGCATTVTNAIGATPAARIFDVNCSGKPLVNAPEITLMAGYEHVFDLGSAGRLTFGTDARYEDERFLSLDFVSAGTQGSNTTWNARLTYETASGNLAVTGYGNNLTDELVFNNSLQSPAKSGTFYNQLRPPRTYGVRATYRF